MPYRFDVTEGEKKVFGHACTWAETHLPKLVEAGGGGSTRKFQGWFMLATKTGRDTFSALSH